MISIVAARPFLAGTLASAPAIILTGDAVPVAIHMHAIARLATMERRCTSSSRFTAATIRPA